MNSLDFLDIQSRMQAELGAVADVYALGVGIAGWQALLDLPSEEGWHRRYTEDGEAAPMRSAEEIFHGGKGVSCRFEFASASGVTLQTTFYNPDDVELWFMPWHVESQDQLDDMCDVLRVVGRRLRCDLVVAKENFPKSEHFRYDVRLNEFIG
jgi:hypothetical protein